LWFRPCRDFGGDADTSRTVSNIARILMFGRSMKLTLALLLFVGVGPSYPIPAPPRPILMTDFGNEWEYPWERPAGAGVVPGLDALSLGLSTLRSEGQSDEPTRSLSTRLLPELER
jgi:hypothetical protein